MGSIVATLCPRSYEIVVSSPFPFHFILYQRACGLKNRSIVSVSRLQEVVSLRKERNAGDLCKETGCWGPWSFAILMLQESCDQAKRSHVTAP